MNDHNNPHAESEIVELMHRVRQRHRDGAAVRSIASILMWISAIPALELGILNGVQFRGISLAVAFLVTMNLPFLWITSRLRSTTAFDRLSIAVHGSEILGYTAIIHFAGGLDAAYLTTIYCGLIVYVGVVAPRRHLFLVAGMSGLAFTLLVLAEQHHVLPTYPLFGGFPGGRPTWAAASVILGIVAALLFVVASISAWSSDLLRKSRERLRLQTDQLQREVEARKATEAQLWLLVDEKQMLVKEVHHRVKNNLQVISSLLKLQAESMSDQKTKTALMASHGRVNSMSMVHEMFYQSGDLRQLELGPFLRNLAASLRAAYDLETGSIEIRVAVDPVKVPLDTAIRVGLVVNELVSNALKHAFTDPSQPGLIQILMSVEKGSTELTVVDDGKGLPEGFSWTRADSLGLQLVQNLARQLQGEIWLDTGHGTAFHLRFPITAEVEATGAQSQA
jgi:two-component sensor histidine kinase